MVSALQVDLAAKDHIKTRDDDGSVTPFVEQALTPGIQSVTDLQMPSIEMKASAETAEISGTGYKIPN